MKNIIFMFLSALAVTSVSFGQEIEIKGPTVSINVDTVSLVQTLKVKEHTDSVYVDTIYRTNDEIIEAFIGLNTTYSLLNQTNSYFALTQGGFGKHFGFETSILNLSTIKYNGFRYYSSNSIPSLCLLIPMGIGHLLTDKDPTWYLLPFWVLTIPTMVEAVTNFKIGYKLNENIKLLTGIRTDFYYFYPDTRTSRQLLTGTRFTFNKLNIDAFYNYPWATGFINNKKAFISIGLTYDVLKASDAKLRKKRQNLTSINRLIH